jgi:uncharacterized protein YndB with AHSA1/START domain
MIEVQRHVRARPETLFAYFTDPVKYAAWMGVEAVLDARPGGIYRVRVPQGNYAVGTFVEVESPRRVVFTWGWEGDPLVPPGSSTVTITLTPSGDGTLVRLVHEGLPDPASAELHRQGWERYLTRLEAAGRGDDPGPDRP